MIGIVLGWCTEIDPRAVNPPWLYGYIFFALFNYEFLKLIISSRIVKFRGVRVVALYRGDRLYRFILGN